MLDDLELSGVALSLSTLDTLIAESLDPGVGASFFPMGRLFGGTGGPGFVLAAVPFATGGGGGGGDRIAATVGGGCGSSLRYADGAQPCSPEPSFFANHQPGVCQYVT